MDAEARMLELLQRAAQELKSVKAQLEEEQRAHAATQAALGELQALHNQFGTLATVERPPAGVPEKTTVTATAPEVALRQRIEELEGELEALRDTPPTDATTETPAADGQQTIEQRAATAEARVGELTLSLKALKGDHYLLKKNHENTLADFTRIEGLLAEAQAAQAASSVQVSELEAEVAHAESQRAAAALHAETLEQAQQGASMAQTEAMKDLTASHEAELATANARLATEHEQHQKLAREHIDTRARVRELQALLDAAIQRETDLQSRVAALEQHLATTEQTLLQQHAQEVTQLSTQLNEMTARAEHAHNEFRHADAQYAQLHREMLVLLDQRDEAIRLKEKALQDLSEIEAEVLPD
jgi:chromosome segregation ATPase